MGTKLSEETSGAGKIYKIAIYDLVKIILYRFTRVHLYIDFIFNLTSASKAMQKHIKTIRSFTERVIKDRREYVHKYGVQIPEDNSEEDYAIYKQRRKTAMLDLLLLAEKDGHIDASGIQEEVDTFMFEVS